MSAELLEVSGSPWSPATVRVLASVPAALGFTLMLRLLVAPFARFPTGQVMVPAVAAPGPVQTPAGAVPETKSVEARSGRVTVADEVPPKPSVTVRVIACVPNPRKA